MKRIVAIIMAAVMLFALCACGGNAQDNTADKKIEGDLVSIINQIYATVELDAETKEAFSYHMIEAIPEDMDAETVAYVLGTSDLEYVEAAYAAPMMSAVAYQLNLYRVDESVDVEAFKATVESSFDTGKWVCVTPEKVATASVGDVVLFVCGTADVVDAIVAAFEALAQ